MTYHPDCAEPDRCGETEEERSGRRMRHLRQEVTRHGRAVWYFRRGNGPRLRMPDEYGSDIFLAAYAAACAAAIQPRRTMHRKHWKMVGRTMDSIERCLKASRFRAKKSAVEFSLSMEWAFDTLSAQDMRCAVTGLPFYSSEVEGSWHHPYSPSLDRVIPRGGYTPENTRIVLYAVNSMLSDWGEDIFAKIAGAYLKRREEI